MTRHRRIRRRLAGTPAPIFDRLSRELQAAVADADLDQRVIELGATPLPETSDGYTNAMAADRKLWGTIVRELGRREK